MKSIQRIVLAVVLIVTAYSMAAPPAGYNWVPVDEFSDEFNGTSLDTSKWRDYHPYWSGRDSTHEPANVSVGGGDLKLVSSLYAGSTEVNANTVTAACVSSQNKNCTYGYYEARIQASSLSMTSAFWFQGNPTEIDVIENIGDASNSGSTWIENTMMMNTHYYPNGFGGAGYVNTPSQWTMPTLAREEYHTYGVWWKDENTIWFYHNDVKVVEKTPGGPFNVTQYMFFDTEVFTWHGWPLYDNLLDPTKNIMYVDWVRAWTTNGSTVQSPYGGTPRQIPGRIEAEEYDEGVNGVAYHDATAGNEGTVFRSDDVDVEVRDGGYNVGWIADGEWLEYTVNAISSTYELTARVATTNSAASFNVFLDDVQIAIVNVPNTGDWGVFQTVSVPDITVTGGDDVILRLEFSCPSGGQNINWIEFVAETDPPTPDPAMWATVPQEEGSFAISMTATTGSDASGVVEYYFEEASGNPGGSDSGWQSSSSYTDSDLDSETEYIYRVQMRDALDNTTDWSDSQSMTTLPYLAPEADGPFLEFNGQVCFEAEHYDSAEARSDDPHTWVQDTSVSGAVGSYMWTMDGEFTPATPQYDYGTRMLYNLNFNTTGQYTIYVRRRWDTDKQVNGSNSVWAGLDGVQSTDYDNEQDPDQWIWKSLGTVNVSSAGVKMLDIVRREDGYMVDRIVLTQGAAPTGDGPVESRRDFSTTLIEYAIFAGYWQRTDCSVSNDYCSGADINGSTAVDIEDLMLFAQKWLNGM